MGERISVGVKLTEIYQILQANTLGFEDLKQYCTSVWTDMRKKDCNDWWILSTLTEEFLAYRKKFVWS